MAAPAVPLAIAAVVALIALMGGKSATNGKTTDTKPAKPYDLGLFDGANDCANGIKSGASATKAAASGDAVQYTAGYAAGYAKGCPAPFIPIVEPALTCVTDDAGITLAQAQTAYSKLGYKYSDKLGTCGASTIAATKAFQSNNGLPVTGVIDADTAAKIKAKADAGSSYSGTFNDSNGIAWQITNPASGVWRGDPKEKPIPEYNVILSAPTYDNLTSQIQTFAASVSGAVGAAGPRARHARPHTNLFADRRAAFPPYVRMM